MILKKQSPKRSVLVDTPWLKLIREDLRLPGNIIIKDFFTVERPAYAAVVPLLPNDEIVLIKQYRHGPKKKILNLPMGIVDKREKAIQTARRELREETGYISKEIIPIGRFENNPAFLRLTCHLFLAHELKKHPIKKTDKEERVTVVILPLKKAVVKVLSGKIRDMTTALGILAAERYLRERK